MGRRWPWLYPWQECPMIRSDMVYHKSFLPFHSRMCCWWWCHVPWLFSPESSHSAVAFWPYSFLAPVSFGCFDRIGLPNSISPGIFSSHSFCARRVSLKPMTSVCLSQIQRAPYWHRREAIWLQNHSHESVASRLILPEIRITFEYCKAVRAQG